MRVETLYNTKTPEKERSECYEIVIDLLPWIGPRNFRFLEKHGWWDEASESYVIAAQDMDSFEEGRTLEEAEARFEQAKANHAKNGFVHSFAPDYFDGPYVYELIEPHSQRSELPRRRHAR
jgi:hypothetical protein